MKKLLIMVLLIGVAVINSQKAMATSSGAAYTSYMIKKEMEKESMSPRKNIIQGNITKNNAYIDHR